MTTTGRADREMQPVFDALHGASLRAVAGGSHGLVVERPGDVAALVDDFLEEEPR